MALDNYLKRRTIKSEMINQLKIKGMDEHRLEQMAQKTALNWPDLLDCINAWHEMPQR